MNAIVQFKEPRLPYHPAIEERYGVDKSAWKALTEAVFPAAKSVDSIVMALSYCRARKLDVFKRPVHIVPMWSSSERQLVETVWPGISELRTTAFRTGQYAGCDEAEFGPECEDTFEGVDNKGDRRSVTVVYPEWCRMTVTRILGGKERRFVGPKVYWLEAYAKWKNTEVPNEMWAKRPVGQIEKCAEAAALRRAFPEEIGNEYTADEMEGQHLHGEAAPVAEAAKPGRPSAAAAPPPPPALTQAAPAVIEATATEVKETVPVAAPSAAAAPPPPPPPSAAQAPPPPAARANTVAPPPPAETKAAAPTKIEDAGPPSHEAMRKHLIELLAQATDGDSLEAAWAIAVGEWEDSLFPPDHEDLLGLYRKRERELAP